MEISQNCIRSHTGFFLKTTTLLVLLSLFPFFGFAQEVNVASDLYTV